MEILEIKVVVPCCENCGRETEWPVKKCMFCPIDNSGKILVKRLANTPKYSAICKADNAK